MDSGSGSMQSSSGGDEEHDSRGSSISALLNSGVLRQPTQPSTTYHHLAPATPSFFDSLPSYLDAFQSTSTPASSSPNFLHLNPNIAWVSTPPHQQQERHSTNLGGPTGTSAIPPPLPTNSANPTGPIRPLPSGPYPTTSTTSTSSTAPAPDLQPGPSQPRASKKRPRASRRAPTTVLTTDTTNFRQMVQEFTGFPAQPFSSSSIPSAGFQRSRLDFFNAAAASAMRSSPAAGLTEPSFLLRPFAQKLPAAAPFSSFATSPSSSSPAVAATSVPSPANTTTVAVGAIAPRARDNNTTGGANPSSAANYQQESTPNLLNIHNPLLSFQSLLQSAPQFQSFNMEIPVFASRPPVPAHMTSTAASGTGQGSLSNQMGSISSLFASDGMATRGGGSGGVGGGRGGSDMPEWDEDGDRVNGGDYGDSLGVNSFRMSRPDSPASTSEFRAAEKAAATRGEGTVDSWI